MFTLGADFSKMSSSGTRNLKVDNVRHKTFVDVDEMGTEAAGVSGKYDKRFRLTSSNTVVECRLLCRFYSGHGRHLQFGIPAVRRQNGQIPRVSSVLVYYQKRQRRRFHGQSDQPKRLEWAFPYARTSVI